MRSWDQITAERDTLRVKQDALTAEISEAESAFNAYAEQIKNGDASTGDSFQDYLLAHGHEKFDFHREEVSREANVPKHANDVIKGNVGEKLLVRNSINTMDLRHFMSPTGSAQTPALFRTTVYRFATIPDEQEWQLDGLHLPVGKFVYGVHRDNEPIVWGIYEGDLILSEIDFQKGSSMMLSENTPSWGSKPLPEDVRNALRLNDSEPTARVYSRIKPRPSFGLLVQMNSPDAVTRAEERYVNALAAGEVTPERIEARQEATRQLIVEKIVTTLSNEEYNLRNIFYEQVMRRGLELSVQRGEDILIRREGRVQSIATLCEEYNVEAHKPSPRGGYR
jgi:hypothetical protein